MKRSIGCGGFILWNLSIFSAKAKLLLRRLVAAGVPPRKSTQGKPYLPAQRELISPQVSNIRGAIFKNPSFTWN
jgi:hypothetical protein